MNHLIYLRSFLEAYRSGSLTRAAQRLGITQPAASAHIAALEAMIGKPLFIRQARGVMPTPAAEDLAREVAAPLDGIEAVMGAALARSSPLSGTVHIVGPAEYLSLRIAPLLASLTADGLRLRIQTGDRTRIYAALEAGHADLAVTASRPESPALGFTEIGREQLLLVASPGLAERTKARSITAEFLTNLPCIAYEESLPLLRVFFQQVFDREADMQAVVTAPDLRLLLELTKAGAGWTVLPDYLCAAAIASGQLVVLQTEGAVPENTLYLAWNKPALRHPRVVYGRDFLLDKLTR